MAATGAADSEAEILLTGGNVRPVYRVGDTVRRETGPWTPAVHALLHHLEERDFEGAPRALGIDAKGREILTFIPGCAPHPSPAHFSDDALLVDLARLLRRYHDATVDFVPPEGARWRDLPGAPSGGEVICHNDVAPWNVILGDNGAVALIDWDFAAPGPRLWDIAYVAWVFVPLYADTKGLLARSSELERARRIRLLSAAYGLANCDGLMAMIARREQCTFDMYDLWAADNPAFAVMKANGHADAVQHDMAYLDEYMAEFERLLAGPTGSPPPESLR